MIRKTYPAGSVHNPLQTVKLEDISTGFLINVAALSLRKHFSQAIIASGYEISTEQYMVLSQLWDEDGIYQSDLGRRVFKDRHNTSRIIRSLEQKALVAKKADANDGRLARCFLTKEGRALQNPLCQISSQVLKDALKGIEEETVLELKRNLVQLLENLGEKVFSLEP